ncbi:MAG: gliding motility-associated C-terminal domain-containing protein, partial [Bacteroidales bacterium]
MDQPSGYYTVVVTDINGCQNSDSVFIDQPEQHIIPEVIKRDISCYGYQDGQISAGASGGTLPYYYEWNFNGNTTTNTTLTNLMPGQYKLIITDGEGCTVDTSVNIFEPAPLTADYVYQSPSCIGNNDGYIELNVQGGTEPYTFFRDDFSSNLPYFNDLYEGSYLILIEDANGCTYELETISLVDVPEECLRIPNAFTPNGDDNNDEWIIENLALFNKYQVQVFNRWGQVVYVGQPGNDPWDGTNLQNNIVPAGSYIYVVKLNNGSKPKCGIVTV